MKSTRFTTRVIVEAGMMLALAALLGQIKMFSAPMGGSVTAGSMIPLLLIALLRGPVVGITVGAVYGVINYMLGGYPPVSIIQWMLDYPIAFAVLGIAGFLWLPSVRKVAGWGKRNPGEAFTRLDLVLPMVVLTIVTLVSLVYSGGYFAAGAGFGQSLIEGNPVIAITQGGIVALLFTVIWYLIRKRSAATYALPVTGAVIGIGLRLFSHFLSGVWFFGMYAPEGTPVWLYSLTYNAGYMVPEMIISGFILVYLAPTLMVFLRQRA
jgi:energy-coupled thiamine transporter ThiT